MPLRESFRKNPHHFTDADFYFHLILIYNLGKLNITIRPVEVQ